MLFSSNVLLLVVTYNWAEINILHASVVPFYRVQTSYVHLYRCGPVYIPQQPISPKTSTPLTGPYTGEASYKQISSFMAQCPVTRNDQGASHITSWQTYSIKHNLNFSGKYTCMLQLMHKNK